MCQENTPISFTTTMLIVSYTLLGPLLGALAFWAMTWLPHGLYTSFLGNADAAIWSAGIKALSIDVLYGYLVGFLPAMGAGVCHVIARRKLDRSKARVFFVSLAGITLTAMLFWVASPPAGFYEIFAPLVATGGIAAFLMATAVEIFAARRVIKAPGLSP